MNATAPVQIQIDRQETEARLRIAPNIDPALITLAACLAEVEDRKIRLTSGVRSAVDEALQEYQANPEPGINAVISRLVPPTTGDRGWVQWQEGFDPEVRHSPLEDVGDDERADFYEMSNRETVASGDWVATIHGPTEGVDGLTVRGETIKAPVGVPADLRWDESFELTDDGRLIATRSGVIDRKATRLRILRRLEVQSNADFSTGHIDFDGQVVIHKGVKDCFHVTCTGDLSVQKLVEASDINAGGEVILRGGMSARGKGTLRVGADLVAHYLSRVSGSITGNVRIEKEVYDCTLSIVRDLWIEFGALIGGEMRVGGNVLVGTIGSGGHVPTTLVVGRQSELIDMMRRIDLLLEALEADAPTPAGPETGPVQASSSTGAGEPEDGAQWSQDTVGPADRVQMLRIRRDEIEAFLESFEPPSIRIIRAVFPNVSITLGQATVTFARMLKGPLTIEYRQGKPIVFFERTGAEVGLFEAAEMSGNAAAA